MTYATEQIHLENARKRIDELEEQNASLQEQLDLNKASRQFSFSALETLRKEFVEMGERS